MTKKIDNLHCDKVIDSQRYVLFSFISPKKVKGITDSFFIFRGAFSTIEEAKKHAAHLQQINNDFDIFIGEGFKWMPFDQDLEQTEEFVYKDEKLNEVMGEYKKQMDEKNKEEVERQEEMKKKLINESGAKKTKNIDNQIKQSIKEKIENINKETIDTSTNNIKKIDETIEKLDKVYKKLQGGEPK